MSNSICKNCGAPFSPTRSWQEFHTKRCKIEYHARRREIAERLLVLVEGWIEETPQLYSIYKSAFEPEATSEIPS